MSDLWVFGYGSLMWRPGFVYAQRQRAVLTGYRRTYCIYSVHHRGSLHRPGLVLGLDRGGACHGIAFRVAADLAAATLTYLRVREQVNGVYRQAMVPLTLDGGAQVEGIAFLAERSHPSYTGVLPLVEQAAIIRAAKGISGTNVEYFVNTLMHLSELGIRERELERLLVEMGPLLGAGSETRRAGRSKGLVLALGGQTVMAPVMPRSARQRFKHRQTIKG